MDPEEEGGLIVRLQTTAFIYDLDGLRRKLEEVEGTATFVEDRRSWRRIPRSASGGHEVLLVLFMTRHLRDVAQVLLEEVRARHSGPVQLRRRHLGLNLNPRMPTFVVEKRLERVGLAVPADQFQNKRQEFYEGKTRELEGKLLDTKRGMVKLEELISVFEDQSGGRLKKWQIERLRMYKESLERARALLLITEDFLKMHLSKS